MVTELYAVTLTSLYRIRADGHTPFSVVKIRKRGSSEIQTGQISPRGDFIGLTRDGIIVYKDDRHPMVKYSERRPRRPEFVNMSYWMFQTSPIVGLFLNEADARSCLDTEQAVENDPRWAAHTQETLRAIGNDHPVIIQSYALPSELNRKTFVHKR